MKTWDEVVKSKEYQALSPEDKLAAKQQYWDEVVSQKEEFKALSPEDQLAAKQEFFGNADEIVSQSTQKPTLWSKLGAEITPEMWQQAPYLTAIAKTAQDALTIPAHYFNQWLLNAPRSALGTVGIQYPETTNPVANPVAKVAGVAGALTSPAAAALGEIGQVFRGAPLSVKLAGAGLAGGATGFAYSPTENFFDIKQRMQQGAIGATAGVTTSFLFNALPKLINLGGKKTAQVIAEKADKGIDKLSQTLSNKYDNMFSKIGKGEVPNDNVFNAIRQAIDTFPEGSGAGKLQKIADRLANEENITATELHNLKQEISKLIPKSVWNGTQDANAIQNAYENIYWTITKELEKLGGEQYSGLTDEYRNFKLAERLARKVFYRQGVPSEYAVAKGIYDIPTQRAVRGLSTQLPPEEQFAQDFEAWRRGQAFKKWGGISGSGILAYLAHRILTNKLLRNGE